MQNIDRPHIKYKRLLKKGGDFIVNILFYASLLFIGFVVWHLFLVASFNIPSNSMLPTLRPGDKVLVDKITTGARLFDIFKAANGEEVKIHRTVRFRKFRRGDILVFNYPFRETRSKIEMNYPVYYAKRCVGVPGDTLEIRDYEYYINGKHSVGGGANVAVRSVYVDRDSLPVDSIHGYRAMRYAKGKRWTIRDFGPLYVPKKDSRIFLSKDNYLPFKKVIERESGKKLKCKDDQLYLGGEPIGSYTFKCNYYFMAGDNSADSSDSRYWGFVPEEFIVGRALLIWKRNGKYGLNFKFDKFN